MKTRTVVLEIEIEGDTPDAISLRDEVRRTKGRLLGERWQVIKAEVLEGRDGWRLVRTGPCRDPKAELGKCGCRELTVLEERQP